ncbi:MAG TPA: acyl-CoA thioester hydrolase/BAAT C-terminal domain-containing protein [Bryobacteraceae bacterium]|nr:acyl-CoA thioester hydrolase/BAAT C-terminal domain-containing protein [Bryobacteraceae bacterium]
MARGLASFTCFLGTGFLAAQTLVVNPVRVLVDQAPIIRASGLQPGEHITIHADLIDGADHPWRSQAEFIADAQGIVDVSTQAPVKGSYKKASAAGLIWSMMPGAKNFEVYRPPAKLEPQVVHFKLEKNGQTVSSADFEQLSLADGVKRVEVKGGLHGMLFVPPEAGPHPGVLVLGGSEGGLPTRNAAWLASHGYAAFALAYFRYENLPAQLDGIPLEYFGDALKWVATRPEISADRIAVMGVSRGGELALQLGSMYPQIKTVIAFVPANTRHPACCNGGGRLGFASAAWTWKGAPLAYMPMRGGSAAMEQAAEIPVEHTQGPILLISGQDDGIWESSQMSDKVIARLKNAHFKYEFEQLKYPHAGHRAGHPGIYPTWYGRITHPVSGREQRYGGTPEGNAESSIDAAPKVLEFLSKGLK